MYQVQRNNVLSWMLFIFFIGLTIFLWVSLHSILQPFIAAFILAYLLNPFVTKFQHNKIPRNIGSFIVVLVAIIVFFLFIVILIPMIITQVQNLIDKMPQIISWLEKVSGGANLPEIIRQKLNLSQSISFESLNEFWHQNSDEIKTVLTKVTTYLRQTGGNILNLLVNLFLLPIVLYYFLVIWPNILKNVLNVVPRKFLQQFVAFFAELDQMLSEFLRGQVTVMLTMGLIYGIGLSIVGLNNGFAIGFLTGFLVFIPYVGFSLGALLATFSAILDYGSWTGIILVWVVLGIGQLLESFVITPKLVGERIGLSPVLVIFALMAFGKLFGFVGMLLALPLSAICVVVVRFCLRTYHESDFYTD